METTTFGRTGVVVSRLAFGGGPAGVPNYLVASDTSSAEVQARAERAVRRALERGVTYYDTAPGYGGGISEAVIGRAPGHRAGAPRRCALSPARSSSAG